MPTLNFKQTIQILQKENLLKEWVQKETWHYQVPTEDLLTFTELSYDSRQVHKETLFFVKGAHFKAEYLTDAFEKGLLCYVAETPFENTTGLGIIVSDIRKAMAKLSQAFYDFPEEKLTLVGITGTKGKTTTNYFIHHILKEALPNGAAMASTEETTLDGKTYFPSKLSTPESLDLWKMFYTAVENHMTHFVMEVSSQAYKLNRVYGLTFDYGIFLNISPDHISENEHPNFDDYFYCKRQLLHHSRVILLNKEMDYYPFLKELADSACPKVYTFGSTGENEDLTYSPLRLDRKMTLSSHHPSFSSYQGDYEITLPGDFNLSNATAAVAVTSLMGIPFKKIQTGLQKSRVPGRMMVFEKANGSFVYVDYAHNYTSLAHMAMYLKAAHPHFKVGVLLGSTGDRAYSRRADFGRAISEYFDFAVLTSDHPTMEDPHKINEDIKAAITKDLPITEILDRKEALITTMTQLKPHEILLVAGKGTEKSQRTQHGTQPYDGDDVIVETFVKNEK